MTGFYQVYERGQTHFQIGDNNNLFDWTYVGNVAYAHLLAADKLSSPPPAPPLTDAEKLGADIPSLTEAEEALIVPSLPSIDLTTGKNRIPTSKARPLGPYRDLPPNGEQIEAAFNSENEDTFTRPVSRTRYDPLSDYALIKEKQYHPETSPLQVSGQVFFITNGEPCYFWDFARAIWHQLDATFPEKRKERSYTVMPRFVGMAAAFGAEWWGWLVGKEPAFTRFKVTYSCVNRWHNIEKARRVLGYEPQVGVEEGIKKMVDVRSFPL